MEVEEQWVALDGVGGRGYHEPRYITRPRFAVNLRVTGRELLLLWMTVLYMYSVIYIKRKSPGGVWWLNSYQILNGLGVGTRMSARVSSRSGRRLVISSYWVLSITKGDYMNSPPPCEIPSPPSIY